MTTNVTLDISPVAQIRALHDRLTRAEELVASNKVHSIIGMDNYYAVESSKGDYYLVNGSCSCPDSEYRDELHKGWCKHKLAAVVYTEQQALADNPKAAKAASKAKGSPPNDGS
jgi:hypothetical protein